MSALRSLSDGLRSLFRREQVNRELDEELKGFLEMAAEEKVKQGMNRKDALRAVRLESGNLGFGVSNRDTNLTYPLFEQIRAHQKAFSGVFAWSGSDEVAVGQGSQQRKARVLWLTGNTFAVLGVPPIKGRLFTDQDDRPDCGIQGVVISYGFWQSEFGGRDSAIGSKLLIQGHPAEVLGVTPPDFFGFEVGSNFDLAEPFCSVTTFRAGPVLARRDLFWLTVMGRLKETWTIEKA